MLNLRRTLEHALVVAHQLADLADRICNQGLADQMLQTLHTAQKADKTSVTVLDLTIDCGVVSSTDLPAAAQAPGVGSNHAVKHQHINVIAHCKIALPMVQHHQPIGLGH